MSDTLLLLNIDVEVADHYDASLSPDVHFGAAELARSHVENSLSRGTSPRLAASMPSNCRMLRRSNEALCQIGAHNIQWVESYVADDKTFCVYLAADEAAIRRHSEMSGFPADRITGVRATIDPSTAE
jgi:Protein of unknown function (DUF4242)